MRIINLQECEDTRIPTAELESCLALEMRAQCGAWLEVEFPSPVNEHCYVLRPGDFVGQHAISKDLALRVVPKVPVAIGDSEPSGKLSRSGEPAPASPAEPPSEEEAPDASAAARLRSDLGL